LFDDDKSGTIDAHEIKKVLEDLGVDSRNKFVYSMVQDLEKYLLQLKLVMALLSILIHLLKSSPTD
jgi:Ca2+-binding EF-hand superfamily protein